MSADGCSRLSARLREGAQPAGRTSMTRSVDGRPDPAAVAEPSARRLVFFRPSSEGSAARTLMLQVGTPRCADRAVLPSHAAGGPCARGCAARQEHMGRRESLTAALEITGNRGTAVPSPGTR